MDVIQGSLSNRGAQGAVRSALAEQSPVEKKEDNRAELKKTLDVSAQEIKDYYDKAADERHSAWEKAVGAYSSAVRSRRLGGSSEQQDKAYQAEGEAKEENAMSGTTREEEAPGGESKPARLAVGISESEEITQSGGSVQDRSGELTQRLVSATHQLQIADIVGEAYKDLLSLRVSLGSCDSETSAKIKRIIRKLEKVIDRSYKKHSDLGKEDDMRHEAKMAERRREKERVKEIKEELRKHISKRKEREKKYLFENDDNSSKDNTGNHTQLMSAATEAAIAVQASAIAAAQVSGGDISLSVSTGADGGATGEAAAASGGEGGAEAASPEGGD